MVEECCKFVEQTPDRETKIKLIDTLRTVSEGKVQKSNLSTASSVYSDMIFFPVRIIMSHRLLFFSSCYELSLLRQSAHSFACETVARDLFGQWSADYYNEFLPLMVFDPK